MRDKGLTREILDEKYPRVYEIPFDSGRKLMTTIHQVEDGYLQVMKGAFDRLPVKCERTFAGKAVDIHDSFAQRALRVITVGIRKWEEMPDTNL